MTNKHTTGLWVWTSSSTTLCLTTTDQNISDLLSQEVYMTSYMVRSSTASLVADCYACSPKKFTSPWYMRKSLAVTTLLGTSKDHPPSLLPSLQLPSQMFLCVCFVWKKAVPLLPFVCIFSCLCWADWQECSLGKGWSGSVWCGSSSTSQHLPVKSFAVCLAAR